MSKLNKTKVNDLPEDVRTRMVTELNGRLADCIDMFNQAKQAHWNLKGPNFIALHELLDEVAEHLEESGDTIAERAVILGGFAQGSTQDIGKNTTLTAYPAGLTQQNPVVDHVSTQLADFGAKLRKAIDVADAAGDKDTADLFTEVSRVVDKDVWFLEAHLQS